MSKQSVLQEFSGFWDFIKRLFRSHDQDTDEVENLPDIEDKEEENGRDARPDLLQSGGIENVLQEEPVKLTSDDMVKAWGLYDPALDLPDYKYPTLDLLDEDRGHDEEDEGQDERERLIDFFKSYGIEVEAGTVSRGDTFSKIEFHPVGTLKASAIKAVEDDFYLRIPRKGYRIIGPNFRRRYFEIEVPNGKKRIVQAKRMLTDNRFRESNAALPLLLGAFCSKEPMIADLAEIKNLMLAGSSGSGKTMALNAFIISLLYYKHPSQLKFVLVDPKKLEFAAYRMIERHFLAKLPGEDDAIITDTNKAVHTLNALCIELDNRYDLLREAGVRTVGEYNKKFVHRRLNPERGHQYLPFIVLVIDQFEDMVMFGGNELRLLVERLVKSGPLAGIFSIISTGNPAFEPVASLIREHIPNRILFRANQKSLSKAVINMASGFYLMGEGDMIALLDDVTARLQGIFIHPGEVDRVAEFIANQKGYPEAFELPEYVDEKEIERRDFGGEKDPLFEEAAHIIVATRQGSVSLLQRRMKLGYNRAGRLMNELEAAGIVGPNIGSKARAVLIGTEAELIAILHKLF